MTDVVLTPITSGYNLSRLNANFDKIQDAINDDVLHLEGGNNTMRQDLDMNGYALLNVHIDSDNPDSMLTVAEGDSRYYNIDGDSLEGPMNVDNQVVSGLRLPVGPTEAVRNSQMTDEIAARVAGDQALLDGYTAADENLQAQITGSIPLEASAFSPISWHDQSIDNSVVIPDNKNAWSFGPTMTISPGQTVTIGTGSHWTIANGEVV
jgi:hypothetical protein